MEWFSVSDILLCLLWKVDPDMIVHMIDVVRNMQVLHVDLLPQLEKGNHYVSVSQCVSSRMGGIEYGIRGCLHLHLH